MGLEAEISLDSPVVAPELISPPTGFQTGHLSPEARAHANARNIPATRRESLYDLGTIG